MFKLSSRLFSYFLSFSPYSTPLSPLCLPPIYRTCSFLFVESFLFCFCATLLDVSWCSIRGAEFAFMKWRLLERLSLKIYTVETNLPLALSICSTMLSFPCLVEHVQSFENVIQTTKKSILGLANISLNGFPIGEQMKESDSKSERYKCHHDLSLSLSLATNIYGRGSIIATERKRQELGCLTTRLW